MCNEFVNVILLQELKIHTSQERTHYIFFNIVRKVKLLMNPAYLDMIFINMCDLLWLD